MRSEAQGEHKKREGDAVRFLALLAVFAVLVVLSGCTQPTPSPEQPNVTPNVTNATNQSVTIIVGPQTNQTTGGNLTTPPPSNQTGPAYQNNTNATLGVYFIDVGSDGLHGNAVLVKKGDMEVLIDAGPAQNANRVVDFLHSLDVDDIDLLISTNADPRNYGGIRTVADTFRVEDFWWNGDTFNDTAYTSLVQGMVSLPQGSQSVERGATATLNGVRFEVLSPPKTRFKDVNNDAMVLRVTDRNFSVLLTSNIQNGAEGNLLSTQPDKIQTQVMQAPYYGVGLGTSSTGTFPAFLNKANPKAVIITGSVDESADNGGSRDPLRALMTQYNIAWYETYVSGTLRVTSDGRSYAIQLANGTDLTPPLVTEVIPTSGPVPGTGVGAGSTGE